MAGEISPEEVAHIARLARLELAPDEVERYREQLSAVLEHVEAVRRLDTSGVATTSHPFPLANVLRDDEPVRCLDRDEVLDAAPSREDGRFRVPRILGEAP